jgi:hypothetical protein
MKLKNIETKDLIIELIKRGETDTDNEGQYIIYTGMYEKASA